MLNATVINETFNRLTDLGMPEEKVILYGHAIATGRVVVMHDRPGGVDWLVLWPDTTLCSALMSFGVVEV